MVHEMLIIILKYLIALVTVLIKHRGYLTTFIFYRLYLIFEFLTMDLKKYLDASISPGEMMDPMLVKSYTYQILQGILFCHQVRFIFGKSR